MKLKKVFFSAYKTCGAICGLNLGVIENCVLDTIMLSYCSGSAGGIVGQNGSKLGVGIVKNCKNSGIVLSNAGDGGGIVGYSIGLLSKNINGSEILDCVNNATIYSKTMRQGGICGRVGGASDLGGVIHGCVNNGNIYTQTGVVGGIVGNIISTNVDYEMLNCVNNGNIEAVGYVGYGGLVSDIHSTYGECKIVSCINNGDLNGNYYLSGCVSVIDAGTYNVVLSRLCNTGNITATNVGMGCVLSAINSTFTGNVTVKDCLNIGNFTGGSGTIGGIVGYNASNNVVNIINSVNIGTVTADSTATYVGAIIGKIRNDSTITNCYYLTGCAKIGETAQLGIGGETGSLDSSGNCVTTGKTQAELQNQLTYVGFDFDNVWIMDPDTHYPTLRNLPKVA